MFWKRERKPLLREIAEGLNISAAREKSIEDEDDFAPFEEDNQPKGFLQKKTQEYQPPSAPGSSQRKKILVDDFIVQRYGDQQHLYIEEPPAYPAGSADQTRPENRHPYLKTPLPEHRKKAEDALGSPRQGHAAEDGDIVGRLQLLGQAVDDIHRITLRQEELFAKWGELTARLDNLSKMAEDLDRLNPFLTKFYDLERKLTGLTKLEERFLALETGMERLVPALENMDDDLRSLTVQVTENQKHPAGMPDGLTDPDRIRELSGLIDDKIDALNRLEEKMAALPDQVPDVVLPHDRFDRLEQKIDEKWQALSSLDQRLARLEEGVSRSSAAGSGMNGPGLENKLEILTTLDRRLAAMEEKMTALNQAPPAPRSNGYQPSSANIEAALESMGTALNELPRISGQLEKLEAIGRNYQKVEDKLLEASQAIDRELSQMGLPSRLEGQSDHQVTMVFDDDQWKEEY